MSISEKEYRAALAKQAGKLAPQFNDRGRVICAALPPRLQKIKDATKKAEAAKLAHPKLPESWGKMNAPPGTLVTHEATYDCVKNRFIESPEIVYRFDLPVPPSANRYWRLARGILHRSTEAKDYMRVAATYARHAGVRKIPGPIKVILDIYRPAKRGDVDNFCKVLLDSLRKIAYEDDSQIVDLHARRFDDKLKPRVVVMVASCSEPGAGPELY